MSARHIANKIADRLNAADFNANAWVPKGKPWARVYVKQGRKDCGYLYIDRDGNLDFSRMSRQRGTIRQIAQDGQLPGVAQVANESRQPRQTGECLECGVVNPRWISGHGMGCSNCE